MKTRHLVTPCHHHAVTLITSPPMLLPSLEYNFLLLQLEQLCEYVPDTFNVHGYVHRKYIPIYIQQDATLHSLFISGNCSTCFGWYLHPSPGAHTTVSTASGISHTVTATCCYCGKVGTAEQFQLFHNSGR